MINIAAIESRIAEIAAAHGAEIGHVGASEKSDAIYVDVRKPKEIDRQYGVMEYWHALVRVSNHYNHTHTADSLDADYLGNIWEADSVEQQLDELTAFLASAETTDVTDQ